MAPRPAITKEHSLGDETLRQLSAARPADLPDLPKAYLGDNFDDQPLLKRLNYLHCTIILGSPLLALYGILTTTLTWQTAVWSVVYYVLTGWGITAGYHRLFAHRAYDAVGPIRMLMALLGAGAVEGSIRWWSRDHRAHHRYVDTEKDPYAATRGFFYSHMGWMLIKQDPKKIGRATDVDDLYTDPLIRWQHKNYLLIALAMGFGVPCVLAGLLWGDYRGGFFYAGVARLIFVHHSTFFVNSLAHYLGEAAYSDNHTAKNSVITAFLTLGEGFHNFHHEFPSDYRNGIRWFHYDPTKWLIRGLAALGLAYNLKRFPHNEIAKGKLQMIEKALMAKKRQINWGPDPKDLPAYTMQQIQDQVRLGEKWIVLEGFVVDVADFLHEHPGGAKIIELELGKDCTDKFFGKTYKHSNAAANLQQTYRIARVVQ